MTEKRLEMLKEVRELRKADALKQLENCRKEMTELIEGIIGMDNVKVTRMNDNFDNWRLTVAVINEDGKEAFGTDIDICYYKGGEYAWHEKGVEVNYGTCGAFDKNNKKEIDKVLAIAKIVEALDEIEAGFENLKTDKMDAYTEARYEVDDAERELRRDYEKEFEAKLVVGNEFEDEDGDKVEIIKVTPKFVTYRYPEHGNHEEKERKEDFIRPLVREKIRQLKENK